MPSPITVALLGYGYAGRTFHTPLLRACPALALRYIGSSQKTQIVQDLGEHIVVKTDFLALLNQPEVELVVIATPNASHFELAKAALLAGKHVVVDKPFTLTYAQAQVLCELAQKTQRLLSVFHNRRYDDDFLTLRRHLDTGHFGKPLALTSRFDRYRPEVKLRWREQAVPGAGLWYDLGPHLLDQALLLFGEPHSLTGKISMHRRGAVVDDEFAVTLHYPSLTVALHASMLQKEPTPRFVLNASNGDWQCSGLDPQEAQLKAGMTPASPSWGYRAATEQQGLAAGCYQQYYQQIATAIYGDSPNPVPAAEAARVMYWLEKAKTQLSMPSMLD